MKYVFVPAPICNMCGSTRSGSVGMRMNRSQGLRPKAASGIAVSVRRCLDCGLIFSDPRPEPDSLEDHYGIPPEEYWQSDEALSWNANYFSGPIATAKKLIRKPAIAALDIGAGTGKAMRSMTAAGFNCWGLEPAESFHRHALQFVPKDRLALSTIEDYSRQERSFDFVTFGAVLEHLFDPAGALRKALELTSPGGIIHLEVPSSDWLVARLVDFYYRLIGTNFTTHISPMHSPFHLYEFTRRSFDMHGAQAGYEVEEMKIEVCEVPHVPSAAKLALTGIMEATGTGMQLVIYLRKRVTK